MVDLNPEFLNAVPFNNSGYTNGILTGYMKDSGYFYYDLNSNALNNISITGYSYFLEFSVNKNGEVAGAGYGNDDGYVSSFLMDDGGIETLNVPGSGWTIARAINNNGFVVGDFANVSTNRIEGFLYNKNTQQFIVLLPPNNLVPYSENGAGGTNTFGINDKGQVVMTFVNDILEYAVLYDMINNQYTLIQPPNTQWSGNSGCYNCVTAWGVNNVGQVVGYFINGDGNVISHIATPLAAVPIPNASLIFITGLIGALSLRSFKKII